MARRLRPNTTATIIGNAVLSCSDNGDCPPDAECVDGQCVDEFDKPLEGETELEIEVPCRFNDASTRFVREDTAERVQRPTRALFRHDVDLIEGRQLTFDIHNHEQPFEIVGLDTIRDKRRGPVAIRAELERAD